MPSTILVIEDEESIADVIIYNLQKEGFIVYWERDGRAGLKKSADFNSRPVHPRSDAARHRRAADLPLAEVRLPDEIGPDHDADGTQR